MTHFALKKGMMMTPQRDEKGRFKKAATIVGYKGFNPDMTCRDFKYELGKTYEHKGRVATCESGFHFCEYPLDVFGYYPPASSVYATVEGAGTIAKDSDNSKIASSKLTVKASIGLPGIIKAAIEYTMSRVKPTDTNSNSGTRGAASNSGTRGVASNSGDYGAASNSGDYGAASNSGDYGAASNSGYQGAASNSGYQGAASNSGTRGAASNSGYQGAASNSGYQGAASNSGTRGAASNSGTRGAASNSGDYGAASNSGYQGAASNSGDYGVAASFGYGSKAKSDATGAIVCVHRNDDGDLIHIKASKVGDNGIKPDTWYTLDADGEFVEVK